MTINNNLPPVSSFDKNWDKNFYQKFSDAKKKGNGYIHEIDTFTKFIAVNEKYIPENLLILFFHKLNNEFGISEIQIQKTITEQKFIINPDPKEETEIELKETKYLKAIRFIREHYKGLYINSFTNEIMYQPENSRPINLPLETLFTDLRFSDIRISKRDIFDYFYSKKYTLQKNPILEILQETNYNPANDPDFISETLEFLNFPLFDNYSFNVRKFYKIMFTKWLVRSIDNAINDESLPNKQVLILKGLQDGRKTSFFRWLFNPFSDYSIENIQLDLKENQTKKRIASNMFILNDEFDRMPNKELQNFKRITGQETIKFKPFGQSSERIVKRRSNFVSATNKKKFITDRTGNVRYIIIEINNSSENPISELLLDNKDLSLRVWSQAYSLWKDYKNGFYNAQLTSEEVIKLNVLNKQYYTYKNLTDAITHLYPKPEFDDNKDIVYMNSTELLESMKKNNAFPKKFLIGLNSQKLGRILTRNFYEKEKTRINKNSHPVQRYKIKLEK